MNEQVKNDIIRLVEDSRDVIACSIDEKYYPLGPTDPDYCILRFTADKGNYWGLQKHLFSVDTI